MPSNTDAKTSTPKGQPKSSTLKNAPKTTLTKDSKSINSQDIPKKAPEVDGLKKLAGKAYQEPAPINIAPTTAKALQEIPENTGVSTGVNKKKQKRRQKEAARKAAGQPPMTGSQLAQQFANVADSAYQDIVKEMAAAQARGEANGYDYGPSDYDDPEQYEPDEAEDMYYTDDVNPQYRTSFSPSLPQTNGHALHDYVPPEPPSAKGKKKKKSKTGSTSEGVYSESNNIPLFTQRALQPPPPPPLPPTGQPLSTETHRPANHVSKDRIWNTSTAEERERIKEFWLSLGEEDRRSLVKVEKEAVLKKMKEQQKHSCSCTVCGRKRTAIEEELEVLYDAYYEELEQYANKQQISLEDGAPMMPPPRMYPHPMASIPPSQHPHVPNRRSSRGRIQEIGDDDRAIEDDEYSDEEDNELSEDDVEEEAIGPANDFFNFGNSLTVQGGILTVADDLLKNDGKKFIEMMEQLAERRMQREEDAHLAAAGMGPPSMQGHNHGPPLDDDGYDEEEEDDYDSQEDEDLDEEDEMESMTEAQRMKEGRRMFQIFAARMFEQRVLTAYREKVALERQQKLIEELDDESRGNAAREAKKAKEAQKKKDKKRQQKQAKEEERAKREAEKAAEEAAARALEEKKAEELRQKKEEQRRRKEAEKKAQDEEKQRKEAEKQRKLQEAKEQQAEQERKQREQKDREKKKREEIKKKEREEREAKEKEIREKKERDTAERKEREAKAKAQEEAKERSRTEEIASRQSAQAVPLVPKGRPPANPPLGASSLPPGLHAPPTTSSHASPHLPIATPVIPKAPTPVRPRGPSVQEPHSTSPKHSQPASSNSPNSPGVSSGQQNEASSTPAKSANQQTFAHQPQPSSRYSPIGASPGQVAQPPGFTSMPPLIGSPFPATLGPSMSPMTQQASHNINPYPTQPPIGSSQYRNFVAPNNIPFPPGMSGSRQTPQGRGSMMFSSGFPGANPNEVGRYGMSRDSIPSQTHSRNTSASFDRSGFETPNTAAQAQPIARPAPIGRPSSVAPHQQSLSLAPLNTEVDDLSNHLGSSALLDDTDVPLSSESHDSRGGGSMAPGAPRTMRQGFGANSGFPDPIGTTRMDNLPRGMQSGNGNTWSNQQLPFGPPPMSGPPSWSNAPGFGQSNNNNAFGSIGTASRPNVPRAVTIRLLTRTACEKLTARSPLNQNLGYHVNDVLREVQAMKPLHEAPVSAMEMIEICDTEGNSQNGGGSFSSRKDQVGNILINYEPGRNTSISARGAGDIGSPIVGGALPAIGGQRPFQQPGGF